MTGLEKIRGELKRIPAYEGGIVRRDLLEQIVNDLAFQFGTDASYVLELFEQIASDTGVDHDPEAVRPEHVLKALFDVLGPYQSGKVTRPTPIEYVAVHFPDDTVEMTRRDQIQEMAIQECGWPMGSVARIQGQRFELTYQNRRAYVLWQPGDNFLIPRYNEALSRHIERRDRAYLSEDVDDEEGPFIKLHWSSISPIGPGVTWYRSALPSSSVARIASTAPLRVSKRHHMIVIDDVIDEERLWNFESIADAFRKDMTAIAECAKEAPMIDSLAADEDDLGDLFSEPVERPTIPVGLPGCPGQSGHPGSTERRSRAPPGAGMTTIGTDDSPRDSEPAGFVVFGYLVSVKLDDLRKALESEAFAMSAVPEGERCSFANCQERAIVPDGGILFCSDHHFKCNAKIEGRRDCHGRVPQLGMVCKTCAKEGLHGRERRRSGRVGPGMRR